MIGLAAPNRAIGFMRFVQTSSSAETSCLAPRSALLIYS
jgi:hypothetical protein